MVYCGGGDALLKKQLGGLYVPISFDKLPVKQAGRQAGRGKGK